MGKSWCSWIFTEVAICEVEGELLATGDDTADIHWASKSEVQMLIDAHKFSEIDLPAVLMFYEMKINVLCKC